MDITEEKAYCIYCLSPLPCFFECKKQVDEFNPLDLLSLKAFLLWELRDYRYKNHMLCLGFLPYMWNAFNKDLKFKILDMHKWIEIYLKNNKYHNFSFNGFVSWH